MRTYAIFTYDCINPDYINEPEPIAGVIGINLPGLRMEEFRYSSTPYGIELRCLNRPISNWFNLIYDLNTKTNASLLDLSGKLCFTYTCK